MRKALLAILTTILVVGGIIATGAPAFAHPDEQCDDNSTQYCLNLWNGTGGQGYINAYTSGASNENIQVQFINGRCRAGSDLTTANCPYNGVPAGLPIFQLLGSWGQCLGDYGNSNTDARLGGFDGCNNVNTGFGGGYGTVFFAEAFSCNVGQGYNGYQSFHWPTGGIGYNDSDGASIYENVAAGQCIRAQ